MASAADAFQVQVSGNVLVICPMGDINSLSAELIDEATGMMTSVINSHHSAMLVVDLAGVPNCSSMFMSFLLRCHKTVKAKGGEMVLCCASLMMKELLSLTRLDTVWAVYDSRPQAMSAMDG
jgi:anti-anti-sigma factor